MEPSLCVVSSWVIRVYTILVWNTISGSSNLDNCFYHCLILISISHLKSLFNLLLLLLLLLFIIYIVNLLVVRPRSCQVIYYFDTPVLGRRHQSFGRVKFLAPLPGRVWSRTLSGRLCRVSSSFSENMAEEDNQSLHMRIIVWEDLETTWILQEQVHPHA